MPNIICWASMTLLGALVRLVEETGRWQLAPVGVQPMGLVHPGVGRPMYSPRRCTWEACPNPTCWAPMAPLMLMSHAHLGPRTPNPWDPSQPLAALGPPVPAPITLGPPLPPRPRSPPPIPPPSQGQHWRMHQAGAGLQVSDPSIVYASPLSLLISSMLGGGWGAFGGSCAIGGRCIECSTQRTQVTQSCSFRSWAAPHRATQCTPLGVICPTPCHSAVCMNPKP